jgi:hypothetical protein
MAAMEFNLPAGDFRFFCWAQWGNRKRETHFPAAVLNSAAVFWPGGGHHRHMVFLPLCHARATKNLSGIMVQCGVR